MMNEEEYINLPFMIFRNLIKLCRICGHLSTKNLERHFDTRHPEMKEERINNNFDIFLRYGEIPTEPIYENMAEIIEKKG